jgi:tRNA A-37 threonylcarbamoyl transferase component Bud32
MTVRNRQFVEISKSFFVDPDYRAALAALGLTSIDAVFAFDAGRNLAKSNLASYRRRFQFDIDPPQATLFLKRYDSPPITVQLANWISHRRRTSSASIEFAAAQALKEMGINTPRTVARGEQWAMLFEKRSFIITEKVPDAESLERKLPSCFTTPTTILNLHARRDFIRELAAFIKRFHNTGYRHRDLYLAHIFHSSDAAFYLIDLARCFRPALFAERFRVKDIAQLYYSAPAQHFSAADRLRFYRAYADADKLAPKDKAFVRKVLNKTTRMATHNRRHGRPVPFAT